MQATRPSRPCGAVELGGKPIGSFRLGRRDRQYEHLARRHGFDPAVASGGGAKQDLASVEVEKIPGQARPGGRTRDGSTVLELGDRFPMAIRIRPTDDRRRDLLLGHELHDLLVVAGKRQLWPRSPPSSVRPTRSIAIRRALFSSSARAGRLSDPRRSAPPAGGSLDEALVEAIEINPSASSPASFATPGFPAATSKRIGSSGACRSERPQP